MNQGRDSPRYVEIADWVDHHTWMICPYCHGEAKHLERRVDGRYCSNCQRKILPLCNREKPGTTVQEFG